MEAEASALSPRPGLCHVVMSCHATLPSSSKHERIIRTISDSEWEIVSERSKIMTWMETSTRMFAVDCWQPGILREVFWVVWVTIPRKCLFKTPTRSSDFTITNRRLSTTVNKVFYFASFNVWESGKKCTMWTLRSKLRLDNLIVFTTTKNLHTKFAVEHSAVNIMEILIQQWII